MRNVVSTLLFVFIIGSLSSMAMDNKEMDSNSLVEEKLRIIYSKFTTKSVRGSYSFQKDDSAGHFIQHIAQTRWRKKSEYQIENGLNKLIDALYQHQRDRSGDKTTKNKNFDIILELMDKLKLTNPDLFQTFTPSSQNESNRITLESDCPKTIVDEFIKCLTIIISQHETINKWCITVQKETKPRKK